MNTSTDRVAVDSGETLWGITTGFRGRYVAGIIAMAVGTVFLLMVPHILQVALDQIVAGRGDVLRTVALAAVGIVACHGIHGFFTYLRGRWAAQSSEGIAEQLRNRLYSHLERLPCSYHDTADTGDLVQRCTSDVETVRVFFGAQVIEIARVSLFLLVAIPIMLRQDVVMTGVCLSLVPVIIILAVVFFHRIRHLFLAVDEAEGRMTTALQENLTGIRVVRAFGRQPFEVEKFGRANQEFRDHEYRLFRALSRYWAVSDLIVLTQLGLPLIAGAWLVSRGALSLGTWILFWWLLRTIIWPVRQLGRVLADMGRATVAIDRIQEVLRQPVEASDDADSRPVQGAITVSGLTFAYGDGQDVLDNLSLSIAAGETVALLGPPGSGKSTLIRLWARFYDYQNGSIHIGDRELRTIPKPAIRRAFGVVLQDPFLYSKTVRANVVLGRSTAVDDEVEECTRAAAVHDNIMEFQRGYATEVGERGVTLSGGQRQRLAIARALLKRPTFLVLDDSLSAVDTKTESHILRAITERRGQQTTIIVTHRLSTARMADRIFVFDRGTVVQQGTHADLLARPGTYARLWRHQSSLDDPGADDSEVSTSISSEIGS